jgi:hypothetical protein
MKLNGVVAPRGAVNGLTLALKPTQRPRPPVEP